jgi:methylthioribose-1-phosphate isomerase
VRGAPMIGVCAALSLACSWRSGAGPEALAASARALRAARPTAVNLMAAVDRLLPVIGAGGDVAAEAEAIFTEDVALCDRMAAHGAALMAPGEAVLTICNTGGLATAGVGTAAGVVRRAHARGGVRVFALETRPLLQGGRLTAWELLALGIPVTLLPDSAAGILLASGRIDRVLVGADRIATNGDFANKIGTYPLAVLARHHGVPFHAVAPWTTIDPDCPSGAHIPIEERAPDEVRGAVGRVRWAPAEVPVYNPAFDVTPVDLVSSIITDRGVFSARDIAAGALRGSG